MSKPDEMKLAADIIRRVLDAMERGDVAYLTQLKQASRRKTPDVEKNSAKQENIEFGRMGSKFTEQDIIDEISKFENVDRLSDHLRSKFATKFDIEAVARAIRVPVSKSMDYEGIVRKIVDATLGYKMRSMAVRGSLGDRRD